MRRNCNTHRTCNETTKHDIVAQQHSTAQHSSYNDALPLYQTPRLMVVYGQDLPETCMFSGDSHTTVLVVSEQPATQQAPGPDLVLRVFVETPLLLCRTSHFCCRNFATYRTYR